ncbi:MAG: SUMF1/EgtB/PvdO family nonheme iron enzyme [Opitutae bacterium]
MNLPRTPAALRLIRAAAFFGLLGLNLPGPALAEAPSPGLAAPSVSANADRLAPDEALRELRDLIHAGKYTEASQLNSALLAAHPHDQRLTRTRALLDKALTASSLTAAPAASRPSDVVAGRAESRLTVPEQASYQALLALARQAKQATTIAEQKTLLRQFMNESRALADRYMDLALLWEMRAAAAMVLDDIKAGAEAGKQLMLLGESAGNDANLPGLLALLKNKGWLDDHFVSLAMVADQYNPGRNHTTMLPNGVPLAFIWINAGNFTQGSPPTETGRSFNEGPQMAVTISNGFWLGQTPVTQTQYKALLGHSPRYYQEAGPEVPVNHMEWEEAAAYCRLLTAREREAGRLPAGYAYRLPTEAEWEYACRAGTTGPRYAEDLDAIAWHSGNNRSGVYHPVGEKQPNAWGLHDMFGGGWEWCLDQYGPYSGEPLTDPQGPSVGKGHLYRGTYPYEDPANCRAARRNWSDHSFAYSGFRVVIGAVRVE